MKSKFEEFNDGIMNLYSENENGKLVRKFEDNLRFGEENVSIQRHYAAQAADQQVDKVIHVPLSKFIQKGRSFMKKTATDVKSNTELKT